MFVWQLTKGIYEYASRTSYKAALTYIDSDVRRRLTLRVAAPPHAVVVVAVVVRDVQLPVSAVHPPQGLANLVDDDGDAAEAGEGHYGVVGAVCPILGWSEKAHSDGTA